MEERILYLDCLSGISGDMTIGGLLDLGLDREAFLQELNKVKVEGYKLEMKKNQKNGITGVDFDVVIEKPKDRKIDGNEHHGHGHHHEHHHRNLKDIEKLIEESALEESVKTMSKEIFTEVAKAEAKIHDKPMDAVHFHEVGAIDSIVDIIGVAILIHQLNPDKIISSPLHMGTGFVTCAHGKIPVPAPATLEILKGIPVYSTGVRSELVTPTGAAIVKVLAEEFMDTPLMEIEKIGYGLGTKDLEITNVLRMMVGKKKA